MNKNELQGLIESYKGDINLLIADIKSAAASLAPTKEPSHTVGQKIVEIKKLNKEYASGKKGGVQALKNVSLDIHQNEIVALVGPSGSGKSTVLNMIAGLDKPTDGSVEVAGNEVSKLSNTEAARYRNSTLGFIFQSFYLQPFLSVRQNVLVPAMFMAGSADSWANADELIELVGLTDRSHHKPSELSGGQMQRAAIARALLNKPKLVLADEPTGNLDRKNSNSIVELFQSIRRDHSTSFLIVTHDERIAAKADRIIEMEDGAII